MKFAEERPCFIDSHADLALRAFELAKLAKRERATAASQAATGSRAPTTIFGHLPQTMAERRMRHPFKNLMSICWRHLEVVRDSYAEEQTTKRAKRLFEHFRVQHMRSAATTWRDEFHSRTIVEAHLLERSLSLFNNWHRRVDGMRKHVLGLDKRSDRHGADEGEDFASDDDDPTDNDADKFVRFENRIVFKEHDVSELLKRRLDTLRPAPGQKDSAQHTHWLKPVINMLKTEATPEQYWTESQAFRGLQAQLEELETRPERPDKPLETRSRSPTGSASTWRSSRSPTPMA